MALILSLCLIQMIALYHNAIICRSVVKGLFCGLVSLVPQCGINAITVLAPGQCLALRGRL